MGTEKGNTERKIMMQKLKKGKRSKRDDCKAKQTWSKPRVKTNQNNDAGLGYIIRDSNGQALVARAVTHKSPSPLYSELLAIRSALGYINANQIGGGKHIIVESYCKEAIQAILQQKSLNVLNDAYNTAIFLASSIHYGSLTSRLAKFYKEMEDTGISSFWGPVTSTTELCEQNYAYSSYIAEFYNTISNIPCILLALIGLTNAIRQGFEKRFSVLHISNMILAIGSMIFHATLQHVLQQSDETPMVWEMLLYLYVLYSADWHYRSTMPTFLFIYGAAFAVAHSFVRFGIGFKIHYVVLCLLCIPRMYKYYIQTKDVATKRLAKLYVATLFFGTLCWLFDRMFCKKLSHWYINPQGHAWWHVLMGFNSYFANTFLMFCRAQQRGREPQVVHLYGLFPYVKIQKPQKQE